MQKRSCAAWSVVCQPARAAAGAPVPQSRSCVGLACESRAALLPSTEQCCAEVPEVLSALVLLLAGAALQSGALALHPNVISCSCREEF
ncbi:hypothetical protein AAFF_G00097300 [Aldrovandia affinis]|uniref:Uncharacterized protein n=1 Tax=Aldrovandia affinis TaxID=143900 RepID=A0AAD7WCP8_9TELE|nr:hypothetical protein AAFF_G00097300 [Aldrovandia affinis]